MKRRLTKTWFITLLALAASAFQSGIVSRFPTGRYVSCAEGAHNPSGNNFLNTSGFRDGAVLTVAQSGTTVTASYVDDSRLSQSLSFSPTNGTTATLARKRQVISGFTSLCVQGPGNEKRNSASMTVGNGILTYDAGSMFLALTGDLHSDGGACGALSQQRASFWIVCHDREGGAVPAIDVARSPATHISGGEYSCATQLDSFASIGGRNHYVAGGATGTLAVNVDGANVTGRYSGDRSLAGTLRFRASTATTAIAERGQTLMAPCMIPDGTGVSSQTPEPIPIATGALTLTDSTLFLSFAGATAAGSSCPGAKVAGTLICAR